MEHLVKFQEVAGRQNQGRERAGWRYDKEARRLAIAFCQEQRRLGSSFSVIAEGLGITTLTLGRWLEEPPQPTFQQIEVRRVADPASSAGGLRVVLPSGLAIEGVNLAQALELAIMLP